MEVDNECSTGLTGPLSVAQYYKGKNVFLTGATGFLGKVFLEKLLRSCPDVGGIYCLVREKKGVAEEIRIQELYKNKVFNLLRELSPKFHEKIHLIAGNISERLFGMNHEDQEFLRENVHIIIHAAAILKFNMPFREAVIKNVVPVIELINFAKTVQHLEALVHVSTAYANCNHKTIEERFYAPPFQHPEKIMDIVKYLSDDILERIKEDLMGTHPNTYTFSKQLAEHMLAQEVDTLPLIVIRPSGVGSALKEPYKGFIDQLGAMTYIAASYGHGMIRSMFGRDGMVFDIIPVDYCANVMIASVWYRAVHRSSKAGYTIYQPTSGLLNPLTLGQYFNLKYTGFHKEPLQKRLRSPNKYVFTSNRTIHNIRTCVEQSLVVGIIDWLSSFVGRKSQLVKENRRLIAACKIFEYFTNNEFQWTVNNITRLQKSLSDGDKTTFPMDVRNINWEEYVHSFMKGIQVYLLKTNDTDAVTDRRQSELTTNTGQAEEIPKSKL